VLEDPRSRSYFVFWSDPGGKLVRALLMAPSDEELPEHRRVRRIGEKDSYERRQNHDDSRKCANEETRHEEEGPAPRGVFRPRSGGSLTVTDVKELAGVSEGVARSAWGGSRTSTTLTIRDDGTYTAVGERVSHGKIELIQVSRRPMKARYRDPATMRLLHPF